MFKTYIIKTSVRLEADNMRKCGWKVFWCPRKNFWICIIK